VLVQNFPEAYPASCTISNVSFLGVKQPGRGDDFSPPSNVELANGLELYFGLASVPAKACYG
jgi:hypothetical protein